MRELVRDAQPGDRLVFHCTSVSGLASRTAPTLFGLVSGHGSQVLAPPDHVEETDGYDEGQRAAHAHSSS